MDCAPAQPAACHRFAHGGQIGRHSPLRVHKHPPVYGHFRPKPGGRARPARQMHEVGFDGVLLPTDGSLIPAPIQRPRDRNARRCNDQHVDVRRRPEFAARPRPKGHDADEGVLQHVRRSANHLGGRGKRNQRRALTHNRHPLTWAGAMLTPGRRGARQRRVAAMPATRRGFVTSASLVGGCVSLGAGAGEVRRNAARRRDFLASP